MRGKVFPVPPQVLERRITPAYAGKSGIITVEVSYMQDHPRLCGEKFQKNRRSPCYKGSPPPMRGKVWVSVSFGFTTRITPAYAGKSRYRGIDTTENRDHPRLCGEKFS